MEIKIELMPLQSKLPLSVSTQLSLSVGLYPQTCSLVYLSVYVGREGKGGR